MFRSLVSRVVALLHPRLPLPPQGELPLEMGPLEAVRTGLTRWSLRFRSLEEPRPESLWTRSRRERVLTALLIAGNDRVRGMCSLWNNRRIFMLQLSTSSSLGQERREGRRWP